MTMMNIMKSVPSSVFVTFGGGLGDVFYTYFEGLNGWGYIKSLKEKYPNTEVKVLCATHNPQTLEFIKHNPYIDTMEDFGWVLDGSELWEKNRGCSLRLDKQKSLLLNLKKEKPILYLEEEETSYVKSIANKGKFVLIHPFAGEPHRRVLPAKEYIPLIDRIIDELNTNIVLIGSSYTRSNRVHKEPKVETLEYERDGLFNLIGKANSRVCMSLAEKQKCFLGSWSAYSCASWLNNKETVILLQERNKNELKKKLKEGQKWERAKCKMVTTKGPYHNPRNTDFKKVRRQAFNMVKNAIK